MKFRSMLIYLLSNYFTPVTESFTSYIEFTSYTRTSMSTGELAPFVTSMLSITLAVNIIAICVFLQLQYNSEF